MKRTIASAAGAALVLAMAGTMLTARPARAEASKDDPNRQVCKSHSVVGSRLKRIRECHTAQEWADQKEQERQGLMRKQYNGDPGCTAADPGCSAAGAKDSPL